MMHPHLPVRAVLAAAPSELFEYYFGIYLEIIG